MEIDLSVFLAAVVENAGGEIILPFDAFANVQTGEPKAITLDLIDDGANFRIGLSEVPDDLA
jgi:hypothetical protein